MAPINPEARVVEAVARALNVLRYGEEYTVAHWHTIMSDPVLASWRDELFAQSRAAISAHTKALAAEGKVIEDDWRLIDSAPKDGTMCLVTNPGPGHVVMIARYVEIQDREEHEPTWPDWWKHSDGRGMRPKLWRPIPNAAHLPTPTLPPAGDDT